VDEVPGASHALSVSHPVEVTTTILRGLDGVRLPDAA
jgi:hypothetical protein